ncbi:hypothetical protein JCM19240_2878 [Vibrio maritimus]|uniref:Uncharacterized protein n=1 Tax=Vibrio maritimus TaxID=990268 RepID=A0A090TDE6_9VIBR|nr:hypothetical protein JCM19240_2878 [Vibrio maritimus]
MIIELMSGQTTRSSKSCLEKDKLSDCNFASVGFNNWDFKMGTLGMG